MRYNIQMRLVQDVDADADVSKVVVSNPPPTLVWHLILLHSAVLKTTVASAA